MFGLLGMLILQHQICSARSSAQDGSKSEGLRVAGTCVNIVDLRTGALVLLIGAADLSSTRIIQRKNLYM